MVTLEHNYRSVQPILAACNAVIGRARERFTKNLFSTRSSQQKPLLVSVEDDAGQVEYVVERVLALREQGVALRHQAVLFRSGHHSDTLEVELGRRRIPFVKYGGLKFLEAAHVKDLLPEICSLDCGTMNFGNGNEIYISTPPFLRKMAELTKEWGVKPELEVFELGHIRFARQMITEGLIAAPPMFQICLGIPWARTRRSTP